MRLKEWLDSEGRSPEWLAEELGVAPRTIYGWIVGRLPRQRRHIALLLHLSQGKVQPQDLLFATPQRRRRGRPKLAPRAPHVCKS